MPPALLIAQLLLTYGPDLTAKIVDLFQKPDPTREDWEAIFAKARVTYEEKRRLAFAASGIPETPLPIE